MQNPYGYYPNGVPPEVLQEVERARIEKKARKERLVLNCVPGLKGKTSRQKFIIKVYCILVIQLTITFSWVGVTSNVDSKFNLCINNYLRY
jgi:FtsH-binding integral membrane protein